MKNENFNSKMGLILGGIIGLAFGIGTRNILIGLLMWLIFFVLYGVKSNKK
ncbi:MAG: hypothetical protein LBV67_05955 [Streptococcaceae bacterium]|jgi:hypothetical protein|nr:hypothetical protein [Streptococcaceae bacterium]